MLSSSVLSKSFLATLALSGTIAANVGAAVIDFESLRHSDPSPRYVQSDAEDGFLLTSNIDPQFADQPFAIWGDGEESFNGSTALFNSFIGNATSLTLEAAGGGSFDLASIDLGPLAKGGRGGQVTFEGLTAGGGAVSQTVTSARRSRRPRWRSDPRSPIWCRSRGRRVSRHTSSTTSSSLRMWCRHRCRNRRPGWASLPGWCSWASRAGRVGDDRPIGPTVSARPGCPPVALISQWHPRSHVGSTTEA